MVSVFIMQISDNYPERFWFKSKVLSGQDPIEIKKGQELVGEWCVEFRLERKASIAAVKKYDIYFSDGPNFISPRLHQLLLESGVSGVQFLDANVYFGDELQKDYKVLNITKKIQSFDPLKSKSQLIMNYLPNGPKKYTSIVPLQDLCPEVEIFRAEEAFTTILVAERVKDLFVQANVKGVVFKSQILEECI